MYKAFGWKHPEFLHLPLICNNDGSKISKRQNDIEFLSYRDRGYMSETLLAYLSTIGGGSKVNIFDENCFFTSSQNVLATLVEHFDETKMSSKSIKLNPELLDNINKRLIQLKLKSEEKSEQTDLVESLRELLAKKYGSSLNKLYISDNYLLSVLKWAQSRISKINDLVNDEAFSFLWRDMSNRSKIQEYPTDKLVNLIDTLLAFCKRADVRFDDLDQLKSEITVVISKSGKESVEIKLNYWHLARIVLTGSPHGPPIAEIFQVLGRENAINRLNLARQLLA